MGEIFARSLPAERIDFTGERMTSGYSGQAEFEHLHRYFFAREFCRDKDVLDIAAGEGYGSAYLAHKARTVVGVEISAEMVAHAKASYRQANLSFRQGDARRLEFLPKSFDVITSFETIEHFLEQEAFLDGVARVLRPTGVFIISSPDRDTYSPTGSPANPFHVNELSRGEFEALLRARFVHCEIYAQRPMTGTVLLAQRDGAARQHSRTFERRGDGHFEASGELPRAPYVLAVASNSPIPANFDSIYIETSDIEGPARQMASLVAAQAEQAAQLARQIDTLQLRLDAASLDAKMAMARVRSIEASTTWRWTAPLRHAVRAITSLRGLAKSGVPPTIDSGHPNMAARQEFP